MFLFMTGHKAAAFYWAESFEMLAENVNAGGYCRKQQQHVSETGTTFQSVEKRSDEA